MVSLKELSDGFKLQYEKFIHGCDDLEQNREWDTRADGEMEAYYLNDIMCAIVLLVSADGEFSEKEAGYINDMFGFSYTPPELKEMYRTNGADIRNMLGNGIPAGYRKMKAVNPKLAEYYRDLVLQACDIIAASDGMIHPAEEKEIGLIRAGFAG